MSLMAITEGARGLFFWSWGAKGLSWVKDPDERADYWGRLQGVLKELAQLKNALVAPDAADVVEWVSHADIRWRARRVGAVQYVFAYRPAEKRSDRETVAPVAVEFQLCDGQTITHAFHPDEAQWFMVGASPEPEPEPEPEPLEPITLKVAISGELTITITDYPEE
jgi:hypothetical protein